MIFKAFKLKSNQKYVNRILNSSRVAVNNKKIKSVGVILNLNEFANFDAFRGFFTDLGLLAPNTKIITYVEDGMKTEKLWDTYFSPNDFGWKGHIKNMDLQTFLDKEFDALICYFKQNTIELDLVTAASKSNFKIGISNENLRLYDFVIDVETNQFEIFKNELIKYLIILNKV